VISIILIFFLHIPFCLFDFHKLRLFLANVIQRCFWCHHWCKPSEF